jgi:TetR/AcrR family transcriptional regulator, regulator of autoinduction and epiphytic fitness
VPQPVAQSGRVARKRTRRISEILRVAAEILAERGYQGASLDEVADRLDMAKASLYYYFDSKESLFCACLASVAEDAIRRLGAIAVGEGTATDRLRRLIIEQQIITARDHPELSRLFLRHLEWPESLGAKIRDWHLRHEAIFTDVIAEGIRTGEFEGADPAVARRCLLGALNFVPVWYQPDRGRAFEAVADTVMLMFGVPVSPPAPRGRPGSRTARSRGPR